MLGESQGRSTPGAISEAHKYGAKPKTYLALRYVPQGLDELQPLFRALLLPDVIEPLNCLLYQCLNRRFELSVLLAKCADVAVQEREVAGLVAEFGRLLHKAGSGLHVRGL